MKKLLVAGIAAAAFCGAPVLAADMPVKAPVYKAAPAPIFNWTGFYGGVNAGWSRANTPMHLLSNDSTSLSPFFFSSLLVTSATLHPSGFVSGGQLGYNWLVAPNWLAGIETDIQYSHERDSISVGTTLAGLVGVSVIDAASRLDWFGTLRARTGYLMNKQLLIFATGGLAYGENKNKADLALTNGSSFSTSNGTSTVTCAGPGVCFAGSDSRTSIGWTAGGGFEFAYSNKMTFKIEYLYMDLGHDNVVVAAQTFTGPQTSLTARFHNTDNIIRVGLNYKFD
jgi:outer membrane immunogenic protein